MKSKDFDNFELLNETTWAHLLKIGDSYKVVHYRDKSEKKLYRRLISVDGQDLYNSIGYIDDFKVLQFGKFPEDYKKMDPD
jgi:hypothetical protein